MSKIKIPGLLNSFRNLHQQNLLILLRISRTMKLLLTSYKLTQTEEPLWTATEDQLKISEI